MFLLRPEYEDALNRSSWERFLQRGVQRLETSGPSRFRALSPARRLQWMRLACELARSRYELRTDRELMRFAFCCAYVGGAPPDFALPESVAAILSDRLQSGEARSLSAWEESCRLVSVKG